MSELPQNKFLRKQHPLSCKTAYSTNQNPREKIWDLDTFINVFGWAPRRPLNSSAHSHVSSVLRRYKDRPRVGAPHLYRIRSHPIINRCMLKVISIYKYIFMKLIVQAFLNIYSIVLKSEDVICRSTSAHIWGGSWSSWQAKPLKCAQRCRRSNGESQQS